MKKISVILALAAVCAAGLSFFGSNVRITHLSIVQAVGIDIENGDVSVCIQYLDINKGTGTNEGVNGNITAVVSGSGSTVSAAIASAEETLPGRLFFGQNKLIVLGSNAYRDLDAQLKNFLSDATKNRPDTLIVKSNTRAEDIINNKQRGARVPAESVCLQLIRKNRAFTVNDYLNSFKKNDLPEIKAGKDYTVILQPAKKIS